MGVRRLWRLATGPSLETVAARATTTGRPPIRFGHELLATKVLDALAASAGWKVGEIRSKIFRQLTVPRASRWSTAWNSTPLS